MFQHSGTKVSARWYNCTNAVVLILVRRCVRRAASLGLAMRLAPQDGKHLEEETEEAYHRTDDNAAGREDVGLEGLFGGRGARHEGETDDDNDESYDEQDVVHSAESKVFFHCYVNYYTW